MAKKFGKGGVDNSQQSSDMSNMFTSPSRTQNQGMYSGDLDIFGDDGEEEGYSGSNDMFGDVDDSGLGDVDITGNDVEGTPSEEVNETPAEEKTEELSASESKDKVEGGNVESEGGEFNLEDEIKQLLGLDLEETSDTADQIKTQAENENASKELINLIDELQSQVADKDTTIQSLIKKFEILNDKYMGMVGENEDLSYNKDSIDKLNSNPKLKLFVKYYGSDNPGLKNKIQSILSDLVYDVTGEDISDLITKTEKNKVSAVLGGDKSSTTDYNKDTNKEEPMDFEESITNLF